MKVRITGNKIRFRLKEPEVKKFYESGTVTEALQFGPNENEQLKFTLQESDVEEVSIRFQSNQTTILVPKSQAEEWTSTLLVGFEAEVDTGKGKTVCVLVEKDFMCMDGREEDNVGSYPNPLANS
jgi:hypothetical protein